jgi:hypothetical protein
MMHVSHEGSDRIARLNHTLRRCPFCGGPGCLMEGEIRRRWQASCTECHCGTPVAFEKPELAAAAWNHRAPPTKDG